MNLRGRSVRFFFSPQGRRALQDIFPGKPMIPAHVMQEDQHGVWVLVGEKETGESESVIPTMLLKWEYIATVSLDEARSPEEGLEIDLIQPES